ncbi:c-type cytochrome [Xanthomonas hyacinthi]
MAALATILATLTLASACAQTSQPPAAATATATTPPDHAATQADPNAPMPRPSGSALVQRGYDVFQYNCAACHGRGDGGRDFFSGQINPRKPGTEALYARSKGAVPALLEERTDLPPEVIAYFVRNGISLMPAFRKTEVSDEDLQALSAYLTRNNK